MSHWLNQPQLAVLRWVADGCPDGVMDGSTHRISAAALRSRGLIRVSGRGRTWSATITDAGRAYLASPSPPRQQTPRPPRPVPKNRAGPPQPAVPAAGCSDTIAEDLRRAHPFIRATRSAARGLRPALDGRLVVGERPGVVRMIVSRDRLHRALVLAHSLVAGATRRTWSIEPYSKDRYGDHPGVAIVIGEHHYPMEVHEETRTLPFTQEEIEAWRNEYSWMKDRAHKMPPPQRKRKEPTGTSGSCCPIATVAGPPNGPTARAHSTASTSPCVLLTRRTRGRGRSCRRERTTTKRRIRTEAKAAC